MSLIQRLSQLNTTNRWWHPKETVLVAVSTGVDSMALLDLLQQVTDGPRIVVVHVNHQLRQQSNEEEAFLVKYCQEHGLPLQVATWPKADHPVTGVEEAARQFRYRFFAEQMRQRQVTKVFTAHHQGDQVETVLMHLTRGGQLSELVGMKTNRHFSDGQLIRPLLSFSKAELTQYAVERHLTWFEDETNQQLEFTRNRYRHQVIPQLKLENPKAVEHIQDYATQIDEVLAALSFYIQPLLKKATISQTKQRIEFDLDLLQQTMPSQPTIWLRELLINRLHFTDINRNLLIELTNLVFAPSGKYAQISLPNGWIMVKNYDRLIFEFNPKINGQENQQNSELVVNLNKWYLDNCHNQFGIFSLTNIDGATKLGNLFLQASEFPLTVRPTKSGDVISVKGGHQKVTRTLINNKVPKDKRNQILVLVSSQQEILAVLGVQVAHQEQPDGELYGLFYKKN